MRDHLLDLVEHSYDLGCLSAVKITGTDKETQVDAYAEDLSVVLSAKFHDPIADFMGVFGMPNLDKLKILLNIAEYRENAVISVNRQERNGAKVPVGLHFANSAGDFQNDYRFMTAEVVAEKLKTAKPKQLPTWTIEFEPTVAAIQRLKMQAQANSEETRFRASTDGSNLKFSFGDHSTHAGEFIFHANVSAKLQHSWSWPVRQVISILDLTGDKTFRISDHGMAEITVDSGIAVYKYTLMAQTK